MAVTEVFDIVGVIPPTFKDIGLLVIIMSLVEISPVKLNPWKWLKAFYNLPHRMETLEEDFNKDRAFRWRTQILRRADELMSGRKFSRETWEDIKDSVKSYQGYCENHPDYQNGKAEFAIDYLSKRYDEAIANNDFLDRDTVHEVDT